jgi:hypothetical protein
MPEAACIVDWQPMQTMVGIAGLMLKPFFPLEQDYWLVCLNWQKRSHSLK